MPVQGYFTRAVLLLNICFQFAPLSITTFTFLSFPSCLPSITIPSSYNYHSSFRPTFYIYVSTSFSYLSTDIISLLNLSMLSSDIGDCSRYILLIVCRSIALHYDFSSTLLFAFAYALTDSQVIIPP